MPSIETGPRPPAGRPKKSGGGSQALTMILAWVGGAAAAVAVAFWILQVVKPDPDPNDPEIAKADRPSVHENDDEGKDKKNDRKKTVQNVKPKKRNPNKQRVEVKPKAPKAVVVDRQNFQRPEMPGMTYRYFEGEPFTMSEFDTIPPSRSGVLISASDLSKVQEANGLQLEGFWETKTNQPCEFSLLSTNRARVWIDGRKILDNTDQFQPKRVMASMPVEAGVHAVRIDFVLSTSGGSFTLDVSAEGDPNRINLDQLLRPFESTQPDSLESIQYELAKYPKPVLEIKPLIESSRKAVSAQLIETVSETLAEEGESTETVLMEDGRLLAGLALSSRTNGRVSGLKPIYVNEFGIFLGKTIGQQNGDWQVIVAKPRFAVSSIQFGRKDLAQDVTLEFMKIGNTSLLPNSSYTQSLGGQPVAVGGNDASQPVVGLRSLVAADSTPLGIDTIRVLSASSQKLVILVDGVAGPPGRKEAPSPSDVKKGLKKLMKQSAGQMTGKTGSAHLMELKALANSTAITAREGIDAESRFVTLLEARRLYLMGGDFKSVFAITNELAGEFDYDYWPDLLAVFSDSANRAAASTSMKRLICLELDPAIAQAVESLEFEVAGKLAAGGKMLATDMKNQALFEKYGMQLEEFKQYANTTKQARQAAKTLASRPDDGKAKLSLGLFFLVVNGDRDAAMKYFADCSNKDWAFVGQNDPNFNGADAEVAMKLADCWVRIAKKTDSVAKLATARARQVLTMAKIRAKGKALKQLQGDLDKL